MKRVLITGAAGGIGRSLRETLRGVYSALRLSDRVALAPAREGEEVDRTELSDMPAVERMVADVDGIVHLGGISGENDWPVILEGNIIGIYNVFEAARRAGVQRIIFATSNHAVGFYPREQKIDHRVVPRPDSRYGVSKAFGEALASLYSDKHGIGFLCVRIGNYGTRPIDSRRLSIWVSPRDLTQLVRIGLEHPDVRYEIVAIEQTLALVGAALAQREEPGKPSPGGAILRIGEDVGRAVGKHEPGAGSKFQARFLGLLMGAHHAGDRIAIGDTKARKAELLGALHQLFAMGSAAQEREVGGDGQFGIRRHTQGFRARLS